MFALTYKHGSRSYNRAMEAEPTIDPELNLESLKRDFCRLQALKDAARTQHEADLAAATAETLRLTQQLESVQRALADAADDPARSEKLSVCEN